MNKSALSRRRGWAAASPQEPDGGTPHLKRAEPNNRGGRGKISGRL